jgi:hypothetical protein
MMKLQQIRKAYSGMKLVAGLLILLAALVAVAMWDSDATRAWTTNAGVVGIALGVVLFGWWIGLWLRKRQRRRLLGMRDSALW